MRVESPPSHACACDLIAVDAAIPVRVECRERLIFCALIGGNDGRDYLGFFHVFNLDDDVDDVTHAANSLIQSG